MTNASEPEPLEPQTDAQWEDGIEDPTISEHEEEMDRIQALETELELESLKQQRLDLEAAWVEKRNARQSAEHAYLSHHPELPYDVDVEGDPSAQIEALQTAIETSEETDRLEQLRTDRLEQLETLPELQELRATNAGAIDLAGFHEGLRHVFNGNLDTPEGRLNANAKTATGETPLHLVVRGCSEANAPLPNGTDTSAVRERRTKATLLLCMGADVHAKDDHGKTAFHHVVQDPCQDERLVHLLLAHGADPFAEDADGKTPIQTADAFAIRAILRYDDGGFQRALADSWSSDAFASMDLFQTDPIGASQIMHELFVRLA